MASSRLQIEGTWEQISEHAAQYTGHRMRLTILEPTTVIVAATRDATTIEDLIAARAAQVHDEEWAKLPADTGDDLDHFIYGTPNRS